MNKKQQILSLLRQRPRKNWELVQLVKTSEFGRRIRELRDDGYVINIARLGDGQFLYELVSEPNVKPTKKQMEMF